jgi:DNA-damage-inducible protein J
VVISVAQAIMNVRIDENIKKSFDEFCAEVGLNASVAVNMFVRAVLRSRSIPFEITDTVDETANEKVLAEALRATLLERIKEGEETDYRLDHETVMRNAREIVAIARASKQDNR